MTWKPKQQGKVTQEEALHAKSLLPPNAVWFIGVIEEFSHIQYRGAMHPNASGVGDHPGVEVWTDIPEDQVGSGKKVVGYDKATPEEVEMVIQAIEAHGYPRDEAFSAVRIESGWKPNALNPSTHAVGLIQLMPFNLKKVGFSGTWQDFQKLSAGEQAPYVGNYFGLQGIDGRWKYPGDTYVALAAGGYVGRPPGTVVYKNDPNSNKDAWDLNKVWDINKDETITVDELRNILLSRMKGAPPPVAIPKAPDVPPLPQFSQSEWLSLLALSLSEDAADRKYATLPPRTKQVLVDYQAANKLKQDGIPGPITLRELFKLP